MPRPPSAEKVRAVCAEVRQVWKKRKGVVAVEVGLRTKRDPNTGWKCSALERITNPSSVTAHTPEMDLVIIVYVENKIHDDHLRPGQSFPKTIRGVPVDVQEVPYGRPMAGPVDPGVQVDPLMGGLRIARQNASADYGTLTCCVRRVGGNPAELHYLTCSHVAFAGRTGAIEVFQPDDVTGTKIGTSDKNGWIAGHPEKMDAAIVKADAGRVGTAKSVLIDGTQTAVARTAEAFEENHVVFSGAKTTKIFRGAVEAAAAPATFTYSTLQGTVDKTWFGLIKILGDNGSAAQGGDSGSPLLRIQADGSFDLLGMVIGIVDSNPPHSGPTYTYAIPMVGDSGVERNMGVTL